MSRRLNWYTRLDKKKNFNCCWYSKNEFAKYWRKFGENHLIRGTASLLFLQTLLIKYIMIKPPTHTFFLSKNHACILCSNDNLISRRRLVCFHIQFFFFYSSTRANLRNIKKRSISTTSLHSTTFHQTAVNRPVVITIGGIIRR